MDHPVYTHTRTHITNYLYTASFRHNDAGYIYIYIHIYMGAAE